MSCQIGKRCRKHDHQIHGQEAEELRKGIEEFIESGPSSRRSRVALRKLLDSIDARDSLAFREARP